jgi:hypothetical protein
MFFDVVDFYYNEIETQINTMHWKRLKSITKKALEIKTPKENSNLPTIIGTKVKIKH